MSEVSSVAVKLAGAAMSAFGVGLAALAFWMAARVLANPRGFGAGSLTFIAVVSAVSAFCLLVGYRLLFNRPNRHGSALSPLAWKVLAWFFWLMGLAFLVFAVRRFDFQILFGMVCLGALGYGCYLAASGTVLNLGRDLSPPNVFPPETALLKVEGFTPEGFTCGIEILNDERTSMEFVVAALRDRVGLTEKEAIETMLNIHQKGGALLPTSSPEEAARIAELITAEAREENHPLICRAVSLSS